MGTHSPYEAIPQLSQALTPDEWTELLDDLVRLNPFQRDFVQAIVEQVDPDAAPPSARLSTSKVTVPPDLQPEDARGSSSVTEPMAASPRRAPTDKPPAQNVRSLGSLDGMFDDE